MSSTHPEADPHRQRARDRQAITFQILVPAALLLVFAAQTSRAQDPFLLSDPTFEESDDKADDESGFVESALHEQPADDDSPRLLPSEYTRRRNTNEADVLGRFGYIAFPTFGRNTSITHLELLPYLQAGNDVLFSDVRLFMANTGRFGGNAGVGLRHLDDNWGVVWGGNVFYDADDTLGNLYHQVGLGAEAIGEIFGMRANVYLPLGNTSQAFPTRIINQRFVDDMLLFDVVRPIGQAMTGFDFECEAAAPGDWAREHALRLFAGGYFFQGSNVPNITGVKASVQAMLFDHVAMHSQFTRDQTFGTNATLGITFYFPGGDLDKNWCLPERRLKDFVRRNYNIIVDHRPTYQRDVVASSPITGAPLVFANVSGGAAAIPGVEGGPQTFDTLAEALAANPDVIYVHAGAQLTEAVTLAAGQQLLGEGVKQMINVDRYGLIELPRVTTGGTLPTLLNVSGDAVTLAEGSTLSGFVIQDPTGNGVVIDGLESATVTNTQILGAGGNGLQITNVTGDVILDDVTIRNAAGVGLNVDNLSGSLTATGTTTIDDSTFAGLMIGNSSGTALFEDLSITNATTTGTGIDLLNNIGSAEFDQIEVATDGGAGLQALTAGSLIVHGGDITGNNAAAVDVEDTDVNVVLDTIQSDGGAVGVRLVDTTGALYLVGGNNFGSGGTIGNKATGIILQNVESAFFSGLDFDTNGVGVMSTGNQAVGINGARFAHMTGLAVDSRNDQFLQVSQSAFTDNGAAGAGTIRYHVDTVGDYSVLLSKNQINDADAGNTIEIVTEAGAAGSSLSLQATQNVIQHDADGSVGMRIDWNGAAQALISSDTFGSAGNSATGISINAPSTSDASNFSLTGNVFQYSGNNIVATNVTADGMLALAFQNNSAIFTGVSATGMKATFNDIVNVTISGNRIEHQGGGGTTILVNDVAGGSNFSIQGNLFYFPDNGPVVERGIIFNNVTGGTINLFGTLNNQILNATQPFLAPAGSTSGSILINNVNVP